MIYAINFLILNINFWTKYISTSLIYTCKYGTWWMNIAKDRGGGGGGGGGVFQHILYCLHPAGYKGY